MAKIQMLISFDPDTKRLDVQGPIQDKMMCYAMLGMAGEVIAKLEPGEPSKIIPASTIPGGFKPS